ncbi:molybdate ABC transporter substrate-binding protein [Domibacillus robiginosus]|uniref:molybdate ABC transporter substrate-binding protein n=1 Tax=Domibacillus robiginosus TaxID=1071054 RepID=UPI00067B6C44|nr:molybdate ABC transporter substrate-binding protein [Domibacillus robiginosus]
MKKTCLMIILVIIMLMAGCSSDEQSKSPQGHTDQEVELTVSAAASLQNALADITEMFEKEHPHVKINYNFGASGALKQQISQGAPVDLFFSAAEDKFDQLVKEGLIENESRIDLVGNELVLIVPRDSNQRISTFKDLPQAQNISIGTPESVPAGKYAKETLESLHIWESVKEKVVYAKDVRQVLTYVETGNVDAGVVYKTDALSSSKVKLAATADEATHAPIIYPAGVLKNSTHLQEAQLFYEYLQNETSMQIFAKYGFKGVH